jgi:hypothetical protein
MLKFLSVLSLSASSLAVQDNVEDILAQILQQGIEDSTYPSVVGTRMMAYFSSIKLLTI